MADSIKPSRWAMSIPFGVATSFGAGLVMTTVVGSSLPMGEWQTTVRGAVILLLGTLATGTVAGARTGKQWVQAAVWTFAALMAIVVVLFVYVVGTEPPR